MQSDFESKERNVALEQIDEKIRHGRESRMSACTFSTFEPSEDFTTGAESDPTGGDRSEVGEILRQAKARSISKAPSRRMLCKADSRRSLMTAENTAELVMATMDKTTFRPSDLDDEEDLCLSPTKSQFKISAEHLSPSRQSPRASVNNTENVWHVDFWCADLADLDLADLDDDREKTPLERFLEGDGSDYEVTAHDTDEGSVVSDVSGLSCFTVERKAVVVRRKNGKDVSCCVRFGEVSIREYERILGDNPACTNGPSLSLGWKFEEQSGIDVNDHDYRLKYRTSGNRPLSRKRRENMLKKWGYSEGDIAEGVRKIAKARHQRQQTVNNLGNDKLEAVLFKAKRGIRKMFARPTGSQARADKH